MNSQKKQKTIKNVLVVSVCTVIAIAMVTLGLAVVFLSRSSQLNVSGRLLSSNANVSAGKINEWFTSEKTMTQGVALSVAGVAETTGGSEQQILRIVREFASGRSNLLNLYVGTETKMFVQSAPDATTPEGYDPTGAGVRMRGGALFYNPRAILGCEYPEKRAGTSLDPHWLAGSFLPAAKRQITL